MKQTEKVNDWSNDRHANASTRESLRTLRQSAVETSKSTANMATSREGWWKIARGTGKVAAASAAIGIGVVQNLLRATDSSANDDDPYSPWSNQAPGEQIYGPEGLGHYENGSKID